MGFGWGVGLSGKLDNVARLYMQQQQHEDAIAAKKAQLAAKEIDDADKRLNAIKNSIRSTGLHPYIQPQSNELIQNFLADVDEQASKNPLYGKSQDAQTKKDALMMKIAELKPQSDDLYKADNLKLTQRDKYYQNPVYAQIDALPAEQRPAAFRAIQNGTSYTVGQELQPDIPLEEINKDFKKTYDINSLGYNTVFKPNKAASAYSNVPMGNDVVVATPEGQKKWAWDYYNAHQPMLSKYKDATDFYNAIKDFSELSTSPTRGYSNNNKTVNVTYGTDGSIYNDVYQASPLEDPRGNVRKYKLSSKNTSTPIAKINLNHKAMVDIDDDGNVTPLKREDGKPYTNLKGTLDVWAQAKDGQWYQGYIAEVPKFKEHFDVDGKMDGWRESKDKTEKVVYLPFDDEGKGIANSVTSTKKAGAIFPPNVTYDKAKVIDAKNKGVANKPTNETPTRKRGTFDPKTGKIIYK